MATAKKKSSTAKAKPAQHMRSFQLTPEDPHFFQFRITQQSIYWLILCILILALGIWVITLSVKVQSLYDQIQAETTQSETIPPTKTY